MQEEFRSGSFGFAGVIARPVFDCALVYRCYCCVRAAYTRASANQCPLHAWLPRGHASFPPVLWFLPALALASSAV